MAQSEFDTGLPSALTTSQFERWNISIRTATEKSTTAHLFAGKREKAPEKIACILPMFGKSSGVIVFQSEIYIYIYIFARLLTFPFVSHSKSTANANEIRVLFKCIVGRIRCVEEDGRTLRRKENVSYVYCVISEAHTFSSAWGSSTGFSAVNQSRHSGPNRARISGALHSSKLPSVRVTKGVHGASVDGSSGRT